MTPGMEEGLEHKTVTTPRKSKRRKDIVIALVAHDAKKADIAMFTNQHRATLSGCGLIATGSTGRMITQNTGLEVKCMRSGPDGGDLQIGGLVASGEVDLVIFFRDPLTSQPHEPDISALLRVCDVHDVPLATNPSSAHLLLKALDSGLDLLGVAV